MNAIALDHGGYFHGGARPARASRMTDTPTAAGDGFADLIGAIAAHADRGAFAALFGHFAPRVKSYMLRLGAEPRLAEAWLRMTSSGLASNR